MTSAFDPSSTSLNLMGAVGMGSFTHVGRRSGPLVRPAAPNVYLAMEVGEVCQLKCRHCIYHNENPRNARPNARVVEDLGDLLGRGLDPKWVSFAGKEATLFPDELLRMAAQTKRPDRVNILMSNGLKLQPPLLQELAPLIDCFDISLDGDRRAHEWMRGEDSFDRIWNRLDDILQHSSSLVGIIATAVHARLPDGRPQWHGIVDLARRLCCEFPGEDRLSLSISLYYGHPADPLRLDPGDLVAMLAALHTVDFPIRVLWTANYAHLLPTILRKLDWDLDNLEYDADTSLPVLRRDNLLLILFNLTPVQQLAFRIANDGELYLGCNHLSLGESARQFSLGNVDSVDLTQLVAKFQGFQGTSPSPPAAPTAVCQACPELLTCQGGDVQSGIYHRGRAHDPYCPLLNEQAA